MQLTYKTLVNASQGMREISNIKLPIKAAIAVALTIKKFQNEVDVFNALAKQLREPYMHFDDKGRKVFNEAHREEAEKKFEELLAQEIDLDVKPITASTFGSIDIAPGLLLAAGPFIDLDNK